jgi:Flp pilus assembly protein TadD
MNLALESIKQVNDPRSEGVTLGQLGTLAMLEGDLADAVKRYHEALELVPASGRTRNGSRRPAPARQGV